MALTKDDLHAVRSIVREETKDFARKSDLFETAQKLEGKLASKDDLADTEGRLTKKIEAEAEHLAASPSKSSDESTGGLKPWPATSGTLLSQSRTRDRRSSWQLSQAAL